MRNNYRTPINISQKALLYYRNMIFFSPLFCNFLYAIPKCSNAFLIIFSFKYSSAFRWNNSLRRSSARKSRYLLFLHNAPCTIKNSPQFIDILFCRRPACCKSHNRMMLVIVFPKAKGDRLLQFLHFLIF